MMVAVVNRNYSPASKMRELYHGTPGGSDCREKKLKS
jgi:hypothetical protein